MQVPIVLTLIGADRPGLVDLLSTLVAQHGGNWLESRMAHLGGHFAGILRASLPENQQGALAEALRQLTHQGLTVIVHRDAPPQQPHPGHTLQIELLGHDRPGIIRQVAGALARHAVNVEELETGCESAPMTGEMLFRARARLHVPPTCDLPALRAELERLAADLMVDLTLDTNPATAPA